MNVEPEVELGLGLGLSLIQDHSGASLIHWDNLDLDFYELIN